MKKLIHYFLIISLFVFGYQGVFAQNAIIDSLKLELILSSEVDTAKLSLLRKIGDEYNKEEDNEQALKFYRDGLVQADSFIQLLIATLTVLLTLGGLIFYNYRYRESKRMDLMKSRIAKDFHDNIGASLNHIKMISNRLSRGKNLEPMQKNDVQNIKKISTQVMHDMYDLLWTLDRERCTIGDLVEHMEDHADKIMRAENYVVKTNFDGLDEEVDMSMKVNSNIYAIFKEAVHNISKHTISNQVYIALQRQGSNRMLLTIKNDFDKKITKQQFSSNRGLANMKERAAEIKGNLKIEESLNSFLLKLDWRN